MIFVVKTYNEAGELLSQVERSTLGKAIYAARNSSRRGFAYTFDPDGKMILYKKCLLEDVTSRVTSRNALGRMTK